MTSKPPQAGQAFFDRIPSQSNAEADKCRDLYDEWASAYDQDLQHESHGYVGPQEAARAVAKHGVKDGLAVLDAGCGTGLSGVAVKEVVGADVVVDGVDLSTGMLEVARKKNVYRKLEAADLSKPLGIEDGAYGAVVCVGTLTEGHVGPVPALREFARVTASGGVIVATIKESVWKNEGHDMEVQRLEREGAVRVQSTALAPYRAAQDVKAVLLTMVKT
ncbi:uncharacterized protein LTR77_010102 [Saxophila tyrrhenica]|uniref:Methyltransferase domain-containing protein n=1 Tax=Saxophila tyrrhenica TaxID=1690608 RepID=A0AAV9NVU5_9PEZI|nr:hypothetical protein LTR77_010102 [Saxophila tyrrhenica]